MPYLQSRANIARAGVTHCGWTPSAWRLQVNGVTREIQQGDTFTIEESLDDTPSRMSFTAYGYTPAVGNNVVFVWSTPDAYLFAGTIVARTARFDTDSLLKWHCECLDYTWLMDRFARVTATYASQGVNSILHRVLLDYTNGGFAGGYCASTMGTIGATGISFEDATVSSVISRLAAQANGYWLVNERKRVSIFDTLPGGTLTAIGNTSDIRNVDYDELLSQVRTRTLVVGRGGTTTAVVAPSATTIPVDETGDYAPGGGSVRAAANTITYTGRSTGSGPGSLTGCAGAVVDIPQGAPVQPLSQADDVTAQTALATRLGGGLSGVALHLIKDDRLSDGEVRALATADVASFKDPISGVEYDIVDRETTIGKTVRFNITSPVTLDKTFRVQSVTLTARVTSGANPDFTRRVNARVFLPRVASILRQVMT